MKKAVRSQADDLGPYYSELTAIDFTDAQDHTRQEFKHESEINNLLEKYGVGLPQRVPEWGAEVDFDLDLTGAYQAIDQLKAAWPNLPEDIKRQYGSWGAVLEAIDSGELKLNQEEKPEETPENNVPPAPADAET